MDEILLKLEKQNVQTQILDAQHGCSDPSVSAYDKELAQITFRQTVEIFKDK